MKRPLPTSAACHQEPRIVFWEPTPPYHPSAGGIANYIQHRACVLGPMGFDVWWINHESMARWSAKDWEWVDRRTFPLSGARRRLLGRWPGLSPAFRYIHAYHPSDLFEIQAGFTGWLPVRHSAPRLILHCHTSSLTRAFLDREDATERHGRIFKSWAARNFRKAHGILACSNEIAMMETGYYRIHPDRVTILPHALSRQAYEGLQNGGACSGSQKMFLMVGNVEYVKGVDLVLAGFGAYLRAGGKGRLGIAGCGGLQELITKSTRTWIKPAVEDLVARHGTGCIQFLGKVDRCRLAQLRAQATAVIVGSRFESFSIAGAEALLSGCALILSERTGLRGLAERYDAARLVDPYNPQSIADALLEMEAPALRSRYIKNGCEMADYLTSPELAEKTARYYREIANAAAMPVLCKESL